MDEGAVKLKPPASRQMSVESIVFVLLLCMVTHSQSSAWQSGSLCVKGQPCLLCPSQCCIGRLRVMSQVTLHAVVIELAFTAGAGGCVPMLLCSCRLRAVEL